MAEGELVEVGVIPTFVLPGAKSITRAGNRVARLVSAEGQKAIADYKRACARFAGKALQQRACVRTVTSVGLAPALHTELPLEQALINIFSSNHVR